MSTINNNLSVNFTPIGVTKNSVMLLFEECQARKLHPPTYVPKQDNTTGQWSVTCIVAVNSESSLSETATGVNTKLAKEIASRKVYDVLKKIPFASDVVSSATLHVDIEEWVTIVEKQYKKFGFDVMSPNMLFACVHSSVAESRPVKEMQAAMKPKRVGTGLFATLGDAILTFFIADDCFVQSFAESTYSTVRSSLSSNHHLSIVFDKYWSTDAYLVNGVISEKMKADLIEAIVAAVYIDCGLDRAREFYRQLLTS